ncbi:ABC transporter permease [Vibrio sp. SM6]|uniref:ABC transporter permease n=1 Tax=Vibrio agarilyticus TaxID=2726741 RepID=A0A7X8TMC6_9VIBR|nr:ABC transporter permease [Vibrio agarilyticus]NLS11388.1 ABC transporter permease [Vibrio agarilyticus]
MLWPVVKALLGHYRRYPLQILLVWLGLTLGVSLLVGVTAINHHAKVSYQNGERLFNNPLPYRILPKHAANKIPQGLYIQLRRAGFHQCAPFDIRYLTAHGGVNLTLVGIDPVAMAPLSQNAQLLDILPLNLMQPPYPVMISRDLATHLSLKDGDNIVLHDGSNLGPIQIDRKDEMRGTRMMTDLSRLRSMERSSGLSLIGCAEMSSENLKELRAMLPSGITVVQNNRDEMSGLTKAFHMNLTAMGMLSFVVGLFIFYQAMSLSFVQRQPLVGIMRQMGVGGMQLAQALVIEITILVLIAWLFGNAFGVLLANQLMPAVSASLSELYDVNVGLRINLSWQASLYSFWMALAGAAISCFWPAVRLIRTQPIRLSAKLSLVRHAGREFSWQALVATGLAVAAVAVYQGPPSQELGYTLIGLMLLSVALFTPYIIWLCFNSYSYSVRWVRLRWFFSDAAASMSYRGVATMAFMLALATNVGIETMVGSFRDTTDKWLTQRLAADLYIYPNNNSAARIAKWLEEQPEVDQVWWRWQKELPSEYGSLQFVSTGANRGELTSLPVKLGIPDFWFHLHHSKSVMISESMALKKGLRPGDEIDFPEPLGPDWQIAGIYYDYGNPYHQILLSHRNWQYRFEENGDIGLGVLLNEGAKSETIKQRLEALFHMNSDYAFDNTKIHQQAMTVFDHTFKVADTLGNITLVIAVFGLFFATLAGEISRQRHIALLRCLGLSGRELIAIGGVQLLLFGLISALVAVPLGLSLAVLIVDLIIKHSFGWSLQLQVIPWEYLWTIAWAMFAIMLAGALPVLRLVKNTPMKSLRDAL